MAKIRVMPDALANKIAAGEVVERPSSVVKELLENALDAGASKIDIEVEAGGKRLIRITDDGEGMTRDDAITAFERHATSKIKSETDLESITTLGFRGEALPSIAAVSKLTLRTGQQGQAEGTEIQFNGGKMTSVKDIAWPGGTEVEVKDLFFNVPARRKFLKSDATESFHIANLGQHYALANNRIGFLLIRDGRDVIRATAASSLKERAYQVLGSELLGKLNEVEYESGEIRVFGFTSNPQEQRSSRDAQYLFVNNRFVRDTLVARALADAYRATMPAGTYPAAILFIELPPIEVDVNVHPAKTEVKFLHEGAVMSAVRAAVAKSLESSRTVTRVPAPQGFKDRTGIPPASGPTAGSSPSPMGTTAGSPGVSPLPFSSSVAEGGSEPEVGRSSVDSRKSAPAAGIRHTVPPAFSRSAELADTDEFRLAPPDEGPGEGDQPALDLTFVNSASDSTANPLLKAVQPGSFESVLPGSSGGCVDVPVATAQRVDQPLPGLGHGIKPLGQIRDSYIVATDEEGLLLIDQHVAHERVLFEQFRDGKLSRSADSQPFLIPQTLDLTPAEAEAFNIAQEELEGMGIETMQLSGRTVAIKAAPSALAAAYAVAVVREVLGAVERDRRNFTLEHLRDEIAASMGCKAAIKINMPLTSEKMQWLIDELMKTQNPMTCPHGRPIIMRFGLREIERGFKRPV